jgi:hypothetical protein
VLKAHSPAPREWASFSIKKKRAVTPSLLLVQVEEEEEEDRCKSLLVRRRRRRRSIVCLKRNGQGIRAYFCGFTAAHAFRSVLDNPRFYFFIFLSFKYCSWVIMCVLFTCLLVV